MDGEVMATCEKCGSETQSMAYHRCGMTEERVREIARNVYREEHGAMLEFCEEHPAAPASAEKPRYDWIGPNQAAEMIASLRKERDELRAQLPEGMKHCTIQYKSCPEGHGRLTAKNWVDHGCDTCERDTLKAKLAATKEVMDTRGIELLRSAERMEELKAKLASAEKPPMWSRDPDAEVCLVCGVPTGYVKAAEESNQRWIDGVRSMRAEIASLKKERDLLRQRSITADTVADQLRQERDTPLKAKLASAEKALDEINRAMPGIGGYSSDVARVRDALTMTGRLGGKEQGK